MLDTDRAKWEFKSGIVDLGFACKSRPPELGQRQKEKEPKDGGERGRQKTSHLYINNDL